MIKLLTPRRPGLSPIVLILLTIILCVAGLGVFLLNNETFFNYEEAETEQAFQQTTMVHTETTVRQMEKMHKELPPDPTVSEPEIPEIPVNPEDSENPENPENPEVPQPPDPEQPPEPTDLFATTTTTSIAYNWNAKVKINSLGVVNNPGAYNGMTREFGVNYYKSFKFSKGSNQRKLHDKIAASVVNKNGYAMYGNSLLMVTPLSLSGSGNWVGCYGSITDQKGKSLSVIYVDAKGNLTGDDVVVNANETIGVDTVKGHHIGGKIDVVEVEADKGTTKATFLSTFGLDISTASPTKGFTKGASLIQ